ncbi:hypothetical protein F5Y19DRAFT_375854 [Xylariaceae sp. FL1651]|nr:hypothetical protein F5Y19DRAFT_375854 [Xylariaceae sp. FL1651]
MSQYISHNDQAHFLGKIGDEWVYIEDNFTASRPPQYNDENLPSMLPGGPGSVPRTVVTTGRSVCMSQFRGALNRYAPSNHTDSTATVMADSAAAATTATLHDYYPCLRPNDQLLFHVNRNYNGAEQPLTEQAMAAHNNNLGGGSYTGDVGEWVKGGPPFSPEDLVSVNVSVLRGPRTRTVTRTGSTAGSSWIFVSSTAPSVSQVDYTAESICAAGLQFDDVPASACITGPNLLDEDFD